MLIIYDMACSVFLILIVKNKHTNGLGVCTQDIKIL